MRKDEPSAADPDVSPEAVEVVAEPSEEQPVEPTPEIDVQKAVVEALAADKAELDHQIVDLKRELQEKTVELTKVQSDLSQKEESLKAQNELLARQEAELTTLKAALARKESELAAQMEKEFDLQERNPNALALLDREVELPDRFPGETRDHVLEVIKVARDAAEAEGRVRKAQVLEAVLLANEPNGKLAEQRASLERLFATTNNLITGEVLEELKRRGISNKRGEEFLLPSEIVKRNY